MKIIHKTYRFAITPNKEQQILLNKHFGCVRYVYNHFLNERKEQYQTNNKSDNFYAQAKTLTELKKNKETNWLKEVNSQTLQFSLRCLDTAYVNFFQGNAKFPKFKSKHNKNTFTVPQFVTVVNSRLFIPKFKNGIKINLHRAIQGEISHCTISKTPTNKYFVSILCETEYEPKHKTNKICGIDLGLKTFVVTSDNIKFRNNKYTKHYERALIKAQKHLSHKNNGSHRYENQRLNVAILHEKISNARLDNLDKVSSELICDYDVICLEDLHIKGMIKNHKLAKHIKDASWGNFVKLLEYKAEWNDKQIIKINRFFPSSKTCNSCGWINQNLKLSDRQWTCSNCSTHLDRDYNAAINILKEGQKIISSGTGDYTLRGINKTTAMLHKPMKSEAHKSLACG
jgi:putative transposase